MDRWVGKVAIVTGASSVIGSAIAEELVKLGLQVVGIARSIELLDSTAVRLSDQPGKLYAVKADVAKEEEALKAFDWVKSNVGPISILVNSAEDKGPDTLKDWENIRHINYTGVSIASREAIRDMRANGIDGHIVHINAVLGHYQTKVGVLTMLSASNPVLTSLTSLRHELVSESSKIKISDIIPGTVNTGILKTSEISGPVEDISEFSPKDVADAVITVLSTPPHVQMHLLVVGAVGELF